MADTKYIVCPHCDSVNRIATDKDAQKGRCGKCHKNLFIQEPVELTEERFEKQISRNGIPVLVDFWAPWCSPCQTMAPEFHKAAATLEPAARLVKVDTEACPQLAGRYGIRSIPTLILFKEGQEIARSSGAMDANSLISWTRRNM